MNYTEWLRVRNVLKVLGIVLVVFLLLTVVFRVAIMRMGTNGLVQIENDPATKVSHTVLPDGTPETIYDNPDGTHVVIDNHGYNGTHIVITERNHTHHASHDQVNMGSIRVEESPNGDTTTTTIDTGGSTSFIIYAGIAAAVGFLIATILGAPLARENDGHLEIAMTKPTSRVKYALGIFGVDVAGIVVAEVMTMVALLLGHALFEFPHIDFSNFLILAAWMIFAPGSWYMMLVAATASLNRSYGAVLGFAVPVAAIITLVALIPVGDSLVGQAVHAIFWTISRIDPLTYTSLVIHTDSVSNNISVVQGLTLPVRMLIEAGLMALYGILALVQWQRVEA